MSAHRDPRYMQLYQAYAKAIQGYQNVITQRRRVRAQLANKAQVAKETIRRPVGSPADYRIPEEPGRGPAPPKEPSVMKVYMGPILGWAVLKGYSPDIPGATEPEPAFDVDAAYDATSLKLYWNAKLHYEKCKREFFDYVRRQNIEVHRARAKAEVDYQANLQMLGTDGEASLEAAQREIEGACRNAWGLYQSTPDPKPRSVIALLLENFADAQFVDLQSPTTQQMDQEVSRLITSGTLSREK